MATSGEDKVPMDPIIEGYRERTQRLIDDLIKQGERIGDADARRLVETAHTAVLEEAGWELRQVLAQLRTRLELGQMRGQQGKQTLSVDEIGSLLGAIDRATGILETSLDKDETAKRLIPMEVEAFDLAEELSDWLRGEGLLDGNDRVTFPMEPAPVRGDRVKLPKAIGSLIERFHDEAREGEQVTGRLSWEGEHITGFVGLAPSHLTVEDLVEEIASPLPVGELRFNLSLVRSIIDRHDGLLSVEARDDAVGFAFELPALDKEWTR